MRRRRSQALKPKAVNVMAKSAKAAAADVVAVAATAHVKAGKAHPPMQATPSQHPPR